MGGFGLTQAHPAPERVQERRGIRKLFAGLGWNRAIVARHGLGANERHLVGGMGPDSQPPARPHPSSFHRGIGGQELHPVEHREHLGNGHLVLEVQVEEIEPLKVALFGWNLPVQIGKAAQAHPQRRIVPLQVLPPDQRVQLGIAALGDRSCHQPPGVRIEVLHEDELGKGAAQVQLVAIGGIGGGVDVNRAVPSLVGRTRRSGRFQFEFQIGPLPGPLESQYGPGG